MWWGHWSFGRHAPKPEQSQQSRRKYCTFWTRTPFILLIFEQIYIKFHIFIVVDRIQLRSDSMASVYSGAGEGRYGTVTVKGQVEFGMQYNYKQGALEIHVVQCKELAAVDTKRNRSDPYVKVRELHFNIYHISYTLVKLLLCRTAPKNVFYNPLSKNIGIFMIWCKERNP